METGALPLQALLRFASLLVGDFDRMETDGLPRAKSFAYLVSLLVGDFDRMETLLVAEVLA